MREPRRHDRQCNRAAQAIREQNAVDALGDVVLKLVLDNPSIRRTSDMPAWRTTKPCASTVRSHINSCVYDSAWETYHASRLDADFNADVVQAWAKNDHLGFEIWYTYRGARKRFRPDFLVRLTDGRVLVLETRGEDNDENRAKRKFLDEWVAAVNATGQYGVWTARVALTPDAVDDVLTDFRTR